MQTIPKSAVVVSFTIALAAGSVSVAGPPPKNPERKDVANEVRHWIEDLKSSERAIRQEAETSLQSLGPKSEQAIPPLIDALTDPNSVVQPVVKAALARIGAPAIPSLITALESDFPTVRNGAAEALGEMGPKADSAIPVLIGKFDDKERPLGNAGNALAEIGPAAIAPLSKVLKDSRSSVAARTGAAQ